MVQNTKDITDKLLYAKDAVRYCLDNAMGLVDMHGIEYWAHEVARLRKELQNIM